MSPDVLHSLLSVGGAVIGAYAATRYELGRLAAKVESLEKSANEAHERLDQLLLKGHK